MPTTTMISDDTGMPLEEGEVLKYSTGFVDVWRDSKPEDSIEANPPDPETDPKWTRQNLIDGAWVNWEANVDEEGVIINYTVIRRWLTNVEDFASEQTAQSDLPSTLPPGCVLWRIRTTEAFINILHDRLVDIDPTFGRYGDITPDE